MTAEELKICIKDGDGKYIKGFGEAGENHTFHPSVTLIGAFPFPAVVAKLTDTSSTTATGRIRDLIGYIGPGKGKRQI